MAFRVTTSPRALRDAESAYLYFAETNHDFANSWLVGLHEAFRGLNDFPNRFGLAYESHAFDVPLRQCVYGRGSHAYRILFTVEGDEVRIHHVRHCRQRPLESSEFDMDWDSYA